MKSKMTLAAGADIKNRLLVAKGRNLDFGPDIGDLSDVDNYEIFKKAIRKAIKNCKPDTIAYDLHPGYFSAKFVKEYTLSPVTCHLSPVQHHHAHIASVMYEHNLREPVIGVAFDGTGFGTDGNIWGGEFLMIEKRGFERLAHFKYIKMPGGEKVVAEPWRMAFGVLGKRAMPFLRGVAKNEKDIVLTMMSKDINSPLTSSAGRLFDACAALLGICEYASHEAEGPIKLEAMCGDGVEESYEFSILKHNGRYIIDIEPLFLGMVEDLRKGEKKLVIATKFHNSMVDIVVKTVKKLSKNLHIKNIALSGGVFQNRFLRMRVIRRLSSFGFKVFTNNTMPVNDLNISLGQYYISLHSS